MITGTRSGRIFGCFQMDQSSQSERKIFEATSAEWRELGFFYERDDAG
jgi:hypothetical protein